MSTFTTFSSTPSINSSLAQLLSSADKLATAFNSHHASSLSSVLSISSSFNQLQNLINLPPSNQISTRSRPEGGIRERGMIKVQETIEEGLAGVREDLAKMENDVEQLNALLFSADIFLATPGTVLAHGLNPLEALSHVSGLHASYQSELIRLRELLADFTSEEIGMSEFVESWRVMEEVDKEKERELKDLSDVLEGWL